MHINVHLIQADTDFIYSGAKLRSENNDIFFGVEAEVAKSIALIPGDAFTARRKRASKLNPRRITTLTCYIAGSRLSDASR